MAERVELSSTLSTLIKFLIELEEEGQPVQFCHSSRFHQFIRGLTKLCGKTKKVLTLQH
jgi:hypothetical protein